MAALHVHHHPTKTLTLSRPLPSISFSTTKTLAISPSFPALSLSVGSSSLSLSSLLNPIGRKASLSHLIYCTQGPNQELSKAKEPEKWMKEAVICLQEGMCEMIAINYKIANHLLCRVKWAEKETPRHENIQTTTMAIKKLADWCTWKLDELFWLQMLREREEQILREPWERKEQILRELCGVNSWEEVLVGNERVGLAPLEVDDEAEEATKDMLNFPTERKLDEWMEEAVAWLEKQREEKIEKDFNFARHLLWEAHGAERSRVFKWNQHANQKEVNIMESAIKMLVRWCERKVNELSKLPLDCKLQEFKERKVQLLKELPEMMKPFELKEEKATFVQRVDKEIDVTEATKDALDSLNDQEMVCTKKTVEELGEAYEVAKQLADEAEEAFILANMEASFFRNLSEKQKKALKKLAAVWSDPHQ